MDKLHRPTVDRLFEAILTLKTPEECYAFFEDVCTVNEILTIAQRLEVAELLNKKEKSYVDISRQTGASTATISRVNKCLAYGTDGYALVLSRMKNK